VSANVECVDGDYVIRLPVRAEHVTTERETVVREEIVVRRRGIAGVQRIGGIVQHEAATQAMAGRVTGPRPRRKGRSSDTSEKRR
jgi:uncharacterized protein (TIGR02271 family)